MKPSKIWSEKAIAREMRRHKGKRAFLLVKDGADSLVVETDRGLTLCKGSKLAKCPKSFLKSFLGEKGTFEQDYRKCGVDNGLIVDEITLIRINFTNLTKIARFVLGKLSARGREWKPVATDV